jgi:hypothetical protein
MRANNPTEVALTRIQFWLATSMGGAAIALAIANAALFTANRSLQGDINGRAQFVQQSVQLEGLFNEMVRALAELSARSNDDALKTLLQSVGITFTVNGQQPAGQAPAAAAPRK